MEITFSHLLGKFLLGAIAGSIYIFAFCRFLHPFELYVRGKRWHHNLIGTILGVFFVLPLLFFFFVVNFEHIDQITGINLLTSLFGFSAGAVIEHELIERIALKLD